MGALIYLPPGYLFFGARIADACGRPYLRVVGPRGVGGRAGTSSARRILCAGIVDRAPVRRPTATGLPARVGGPPVHATQLLRHAMTRVKVRARRNGHAWGLGQRRVRRGAAGRHGPTWAGRWGRGRDRVTRQQCPHAQEVCVWLACFPRLVPPGVIRRGGRARRMGVFMLHLQQYELCEARLARFRPLR